MIEKEGFTLIELLVVIVIIGILASIVLTNVNGARIKAKDVAIKRSMNVFNYLAEIYYDSHNENYAGFCNDSETERIFDAIYSPKKYKYCHHDSNQWAVCAQLNFPPDLSKAWCTDSIGNTKQINQSDCVANITFCP